ncbi:centrosomal protein of 135 kDa [Eupeodes corollae]|uniref:centrosomal protein of 135 kDa n=1 Tax=Eupeodes corollae TaxID=290404 RepID=UPI00248F4BA9|nr:centrosomal protein of 135 kDa [Eupeodes corollae]
MSVDCIYNNLRQKLDVLGYTQPLPLAAITLVGALFEDLVKTTESLRDSKLKICNLLEEKSCWELDVEPYKCDNSRLLAECNQLHLELIKQKEDSEEKICDLNQRIRNLECDKNYLDEHCQHLQAQIKAFILKSIDSNSVKNNKNGVNMNKKPFVSTVRSGEFIPNAFSENASIKCTKCSVGFCKQFSAGSANPSAPEVQMEKLENNIKDLNDQVAFYKKKIESRDREIRRLNELLAGGRPPAALAKDCCYKDIGTLSEDVELLQREKSESLCKIREYQDKMHEAMQRAMDLEGKNKKLQRELDELKEAALAIESQANTEIAEREKEIEDLKADLQRLKDKFETRDFSSAPSKSSAEEKRIFNERLNELTQRESELELENEKLMKKNHKLKCRLTSCQKENVYKNVQDDHKCVDEERIRLKSERDFFQKEYLRMLGKAGSDKEIEFLQSQVKSKDDELRLLRSELCVRQQHPSARSDKSSNSECVQAIVIRAERERDVVKVELERIRNERDTLREKLQSFTLLQADSSQKYQEKIHELTNKITALECDNRDLNSARVPSQTQIVLLKEEIDGLKKKLFELQEENCKLKSSQNQLRLLQDQTERALSEYQNKLAAAEAQLESAESQLNNYGTNRDASRNEIETLKNEIASLKSTYVKMENEKDKIVAELDAKTEKVYQLEFDLKATKDKRNDLERQVKELERKLEFLSTQSLKRDSELQDTSTESKSLRQQLAALKSSREQAIEENGRLSNDLAESQADIATLKRRLKDSEVEIERLKQQLKQYVQEVKKAEDLLLHKEKEREEMLDHYRSLSHDAVLLEGNNQSLEVEAAECKRQLCEAEDEIAALKKELATRKDIIDKLEAQIDTLKTQNTFLENQIEEAYDEQQLLKVDLAARKELCDKLDIQRDKLNAEVFELNKIRKKLERDNEKLRAENDRTLNGTKATADTFEDLLSKTRRELEEQIKVDSRLSQELIRMKERNEDLLQQLKEERDKRRQHENLAREYDVQVKELRHNITDERFRQARSREESPKFTTM